MDLRDKTDEQIVKILNNIALQAVWHGADMGGSYAQNEEYLCKAMYDAIDFFGLKDYCVAKVLSCGGFILIMRKDDLPAPDNFAIKWIGDPPGHPELIY